jgi:dolichol-phosphate mannosyltransferase
MTVYIVLPAYNEEGAIGSLLDRVSSHGSDLGANVRVIVVDDGSSDRTVDIAGSHPLAAAGSLEVVRHVINRGLAAAVETGIAEFLKRAGDPDDVMVTMDADDTHDPVYVAGLLERIRAGADIAICSRFVAGGEERGVSAFRKILSRGAKRFMDLLAPIPGIKDISCGYRAYSRSMLARMSCTYGAHVIQTIGGSVQAELLIRALALGSRIEEIPFTLRYDLKQGPSKLGMATTIKGYFLLRGIKRQSEREAALDGVSDAAGPVDGKGVLTLICTYNEKENIRPLVDRIFELVPGISVLIVDDNSPDGTGELIEDMKSANPRLHLLRRAGKLGLGSAITAGLKWAVENRFETAVNMDADFSHDPVMLPEFIRRGREADYVIGSRYVAGGGTLNWSLRRRLLSRGGNTFARVMLGVPVHDLTTGYRLVRLSRAGGLQLENISAKGYGFLIEMTFRAVQSGLSVKEVPIRFLDRRFGESKMSANIIEEAFLLVLRLRRERVKAKG